MSHNLFVTADHQPSGQRAQHQLDRRSTRLQLVYEPHWRQADNPRAARDRTGGRPTPDPSQWVLVHQKTSGVHPDSRPATRGETWFLQFDPSTNPEGATAAVEIATKFSQAFGYSQVETLPSPLDLAHASIDPKATKRRPSGARTPFTWDDVHAILERVAKNPDGTYRVVAGRMIRGRILGNFLYDGASRRSQRHRAARTPPRAARPARLRVLGDLTDLKASSTLDTVIEENGRSIVKHYLLGRRLGVRACANDVHECGPELE